MRPEKLYYKMDIAIEHWLDTHNNSKLLPLIPALERMWRQRSKQEDDYRTGEETYKYDDGEIIHNNMRYIWGRWKCAFRIRWLLDGLNNGKI